MNHFQAIHFVVTSLWILFNLNLTVNSEETILYPNITLNACKDGDTGSIHPDEIPDGIIQLDNWVLEIHKNHNLKFASNFKSTWFYANDSNADEHEEKSTRHENMAKCGAEDENCTKKNNSTTHKCQYVKNEAHECVSTDNAKFPDENNEFRKTVKNNQQQQVVKRDCNFYNGVVKRMNNDDDYNNGTSFAIVDSRVAATICTDSRGRRSVIGFFSVVVKHDRATHYHFIEPLVNPDVTSPKYGNVFPHFVFTLDQDKFTNEIKSHSRNKRHSSSTNFLFNLTGDTFDEFYTQNNSTVNEFKISSDQERRTERPMEIKWRKEDLEEEQFGYFYDTAWDLLPTYSGGGSDGVEGYNRKPVTSSGLSGAAAATSVSSFPQRWLEIAVAADHSLVAFHGRARVEQYIVSLMNIVSAIYKDSSLGSNLKLVMTRLFLYEEKRYSQIREGNAKRSLENVNRWNQKTIANLQSGETPHDIAVWLTRLDIGGPSGYAPVSGTCDPVRSCALNRDEGLTSAFIIAHEMAHILGLTHDGDIKAGNNCDNEASSGSLMAPMVQATFHHFTWSDCSRKEFHQKALQWPCLANPPDGTNFTDLENVHVPKFSMDEQCRLEFGDGYSLCRSFDIVEPCTHLWCGHFKSPLVCKTKRGPPLEGTECGFDKWCVNGYCELVDERRLSGGGGRTIDDPVLHNPQDGGWGDWSSWGPCSRSCGVGASFRSRRCNKPRPAYGGLECEGPSEEFRICSIAECPEPLRDFRAQQCSRLYRMIPAELNDTRANMTWIPHESDNDILKCQLTCVSQETGELYLSGENLIDGTPCSYDNPTDRCIQGVCQKIGCDGHLESNLTTDSCGVCSGKDKLCINATSEFERSIKREISRIAIIPRLAQRVSVEVNITTSSLSERASFAAPPGAPLITLILRDRRKRRYDVMSSTLSQPIVNVASATADAIKTGRAEGIDLMHKELPSRAANVIIEGAKFYYTQVGSTERLFARGPLLGEVIVLLYVPSEELTRSTVSASVSVGYVLHRDSLATSARHRWIEGGWGPCSASCGGGKRVRTVACRDTHADRIVPRRHCSLAAKPPLVTEPCNNISCAFHWTGGDWEYCSATCGSRGLQTRDLYCVPQAVTSGNETAGDISELWRHMVAPNRCPRDNKPQEVRACNRFPCPAYWVHGPWSQCSTTCGIGYSTRDSYCPVMADEPLFSCGPSPPLQRHACKGHTRRTHPLCRRPRRGHGPRRKKCSKDSFEHCALVDYIGKYCVVGEFRKVCCKSCTLNALPE